MKNKIHFQSRSLVVADDLMEKTISLACRAAKNLSPVLISGESGTGKELIARYIHERSVRREGAFVSVNCAAIPENLIEAELFGFERGAFTGAIHQRIGKFERANQGTLLLDEISEMPVNLQAKLLRVIQEGEVDRIGGRDPVLINSRLIATTNRELPVLIQNERFREDLYYRINVIEIHCAPLRGRQEAIVALAADFLGQACLKQEREFTSFSSEALDKLVQHSWPGNIRELQNAIERAVWLGDGDILQADFFDLKALPVRAAETQNSSTTLADLEKGHIIQVLTHHQGNQTRAAEVLGITSRTLRNKLKLYRV